MVPGCITEGGGVAAGQDQQTSPSKARTNMSSNKRPLFVVRWNNVFGSGWTLVDTCITQEKADALAKDFRDMGEQASISVEYP
jgi:hypothetical protein